MAALALVVPCTHMVMMLTLVYGVQDLVKKHSEFISYPISLWIEKTTEKEVDDDEADDDDEPPKEDEEGKIEEVTDDEAKKDKKKKKVRILCSLLFSSPFPFLHLV